MAEEIIRDWAEEFDGGDLSYVGQDDIEAQGLQIVHPMSSTLKAAGGIDGRWFDVQTERNFERVSVQFLLPFAEHQMGIPKGTDERKKLFSKLSEEDEQQARILASEDAYSLCYSPNNRWASSGIRAGHPCASCPYGRRGTNTCARTFHAHCVLVGDKLPVSRKMRQKLGKATALNSRWFSDLSLRLEGVLAPTLVFELEAVEDGRAMSPVTVSVRQATDEELEFALGIFREHVRPAKAALDARIAKAAEARAKLEDEERKRRAESDAGQEAGGPRAEEPITTRAWQAPPLHTIGESEEEPKPTSRRRVVQVGDDA